MKKSVYKLFGWLMLAIALVSLATTSAMAQLDESSGTNAVTALNGNVQNAGSVLYPILIAIVAVMGVIGIYYRFVGKAKVGT